jgi:hypothetical protein
MTQTPEPTKKEGVISDYAETRKKQDIDKQVIETTYAVLNSPVMQAISPNLENLAVGHAGLYPDEEKSITEITEKDIDVYTADIDIKSMAGLGKVLKVEDGINDFVDQLRLDKTNHLPNTITGVWVYYLTQGIQRDFRRTWNETPASLKKRLTDIEKKYRDGTRVMTRKQKNELLAQTDYNYYREDIRNGTITREEAHKSMNEAIEKVDKLESEGFYLPMKKTEPIRIYDLDKEINESAKTKYGTQIYKKYKIEVIYPNILQKYDEEKKLRAQHTTDVDKSGFKDYKLDDWRNPYNIKYMNEFPFRRYFDEYKLILNTIHIGKWKKKGARAFRFIIFDCYMDNTISKLYPESKERALILYSPKSLGVGNITPLLEETGISYNIEEHPILTQ